MKKEIVLVFVLLIIAITACSSDATTVSQNLSTAADQFEINRRVVFYNGITGDYMLLVEGLCSIEADGIDNQLEVTCKTGDETYRKHFLGLSDNVTYFAEQLEVVHADPYHHRVIFKPELIVPNVDLETSFDK